ncbi:MAG: hypothetical protein U0132_22115 [Gemmatimonadaceae bacterium]
MSNISTLASGAEVSAQHLASTMFKAAILANVHAGVITLDIEQEPGEDTPSARLMVTPTGQRHLWPEHTLEGRLLLGQQRRVRDIAFDWLGSESSDPSARAVLQGYVMLTIRGHAAYTPPTRYKVPKYAIAKGAKVSSSQFGAAHDLLTRCQRERPEIWHQLDAEFAGAIALRTVPVRKDADGYEITVGTDPWMDERASDRERFGAEPPSPYSTSALAYTLLLLVVSGIGFVLMQSLGKWGFALKAATVIAVLLGVIEFLYRTWPPFNDALRDLGRSLLTAFKQKGQPLPPPPKVGRYQTIVGWIILVEYLTIVTVALHKAGPDVTRLWLLPAGALVFWLIVRMRRRVSAAITARVFTATTSPGTRTAAATPAAPALPLTAKIGPTSVESAPHVAQPLAAESALSIKVLRGDTLPEPSAASVQLLDVKARRAVAIRSLFHRAITMLSLITFALAMLHWLLAQQLSVEPSNAGFPTFVAVLAAVTLLSQTRGGAAKVRSTVLTTVMRLIFGETAKVSGGEMDDDKGSIRPVALTVVMGAWSLFALAYTASFASSLRPPYGRVVALGSMAIVTGVVLWFQRRRSAIERRFPCPRPKSLLALRVFGSPHLADFLDLTNDWQWIGSRLRLDGPGTTGQKARDLVNYVAGRIDQSIVQSEAELERAMAEFAETPDRQLRFPVNSVQCSDAIWKQAIDRLLDRSDAVVMDLASLTPTNRGVAYELGRLFAHIDLDRIVLLINDTTDRNVLREIVDRAWADVPVNSPNAGRASPAVIAFDMGGSAARLPEESLADWQRRRHTTVDSRRLLGLLADAAEPPRSSNAEAVLSDDLVRHWSWFPLPKPLRVVRNAAVMLFILSTVFATTCVTRVPAGQIGSTATATVPTQRGSAGTPTITTR